MQDIESVKGTKLRRRSRKLTEVLWQESDRDDVECEGEDLTDDHERVPSRDLDGDHDEFVQDECVKEIETMLRNSDSKRTRDASMIAPPA